MEPEVDEDIVIKRLKQSISSNFKDNKESNVLFKESLESYKQSSFGTRKVAVENLYQLMFMPYQKDYFVLYHIVEQRASEIELGTFSF